MRQPLQAPAVPNLFRVVKGCGWSYTITSEGVVPFANLSNPGLFGLEVELLPKYCTVMTCRPVLGFGVERRRELDNSSGSSATSRRPCRSPLRHQTF